MALPITFLSDYGSADEFAGVCRAVIARIAPAAPVIDLTHGVERHAVRQGALVLAGALEYAPAGVHLAVVDPGVGTDRRAVAVRAGDGRLLVGPDNGLLSPAIESLGGAGQAVEISASPVRLEPVSMTFHGRDVFAPVAAHLANGAEPAELGEPLDPASLTVLELPRSIIEPGRAIAHALYADGFGNVVIDLVGSELALLGLEPGAAFVAETAGASARGTLGRAFADVELGGLVLYADAGDHLALAVNRGSVAKLLGLAAGEEVVVRPA